MFDEVRFPINISYGSRGGPGFKTNVVTTDSGAEQRVARWTSARRQFNAAYGVKSYADLVALSDFYIARLGVTRGFRYKDWLDFTTAVDRRSAPSLLDVSIGIGDGATTNFQLCTKYGTKVRNISKPVTGTELVALNGVLQTSGYTIDYTTGIITFSTAPAIGVVVTAGCEFDVPVRFGTEIDDTLQLSIDDFGSGSSQSIPLVELADGTVTYDDYFFGGAYEKAIAADLQLSLSNGRVQAINPTATSLKVKLPSTAGILPGGPIFYIFNEGSHDLIVADLAGSTLVTLSAGEGCEVILSVTSDNATKVWYIL
jgi:uncharacterized protein (TIGR02217 family)